MNNRERNYKTDKVGIYHLILRKKDNDRRNKELCFREVVRGDESIDSLKARVKNIPGRWRLYRSFNKRLVRPARLLLMQALIDENEAVKFDYRIDSLWKNCLAQKVCKGEKNFMLDIDLPWSEEEVDKFITEKELQVSEIVKTPSGGWHILFSHCDTRPLQGIEGVEVKRDDLIFVEEFTIKLTNEEYFNRVMELKDYYQSLNSEKFEEQYIKQKHIDLLNERDMCLDQLKISPQDINKKINTKTVKMIRELEDIK